MPLSSEQKMVAVCSSKTAVHCSKSTQYYIEKYSNLKSAVGGMKRFSPYNKTIILGGKS